MTERLIPIDKEKPVVCIDFDGVLNTYKGYDGDNLGTPREGCREFLEELNENYTVMIYSVRRYSKIIGWLKDNDLIHLVTNVTSYKLPAVAYIDDRAIPFDGDYSKAVKKLKGFKPYWQK